MAVPGLSKAPRSPTAASRGQHLGRQCEGCPQQVISLKMMYANPYASEALEFSLYSSWGHRTGWEVTMLWSHPVPHPCCSRPTAGREWLYGYQGCSGPRTGMSLRAGTGSVVPERGGAIPGEARPHRGGEQHPPSSMRWQQQWIWLWDGDRDP